MRDDDSDFKKPNDKSASPNASDIDALKRGAAELMGVASACNAVVLFVRAARKAQRVECGAENAVTVAFDDPRDAAEFTAIMRSLIPQASSSTPVAPTA